MSKRPTPEKAGWVLTAKQRGYPGPMAMWLDLYVTQGQSLRALGWQFGVGQRVIHRQLIEHGITRRPISGVTGSAETTGSDRR